MKPLRSDQHLAGPRGTKHSANQLFGCLWKRNGLIKTTHRAIIAYILTIACTPESKLYGKLILTNQGIALAVNCSLSTVKRFFRLMQECEIIEIGEWVDEGPFHSTLRRQITVNWDLLYEIMNSEPDRPTRPKTWREKHLESSTISNGVTETPDKEKSTISSTVLSLNYVVAKSEPDMEASLPIGDSPSAHPQVQNQDSLSREGGQIETPLVQKTENSMPSLLERIKNRTPKPLEDIEPPRAGLPPGMTTRTWIEEKRKQNKGLEKVGKFANFSDEPKINELEEPELPTVIGHTVMRPSGSHARQLALAYSNLAIPTPPILNSQPPSSRDVLIITPPRPELSSTIRDFLDPPPVEESPPPMRVNQEAELEHLFCSLSHEERRIIKRNETIDAMQEDDPNIQKFLAWEEIDFQTLCWRMRENVNYHPFSKDENGWRDDCHPKYAIMSDEERDREFIGYYELWMRPFKLIETRGKQHKQLTTMFRNTRKRADSVKADYQDFIVAQYDSWGSYNLNHIRICAKSGIDCYNRWVEEGSHYPTNDGWVSFYNQQVWQSEMRKSKRPYKARKRTDIKDEIERTRQKAIEQVKGWDWRKERRES